MVRYRERLWVPARWWLLFVLLDASVWLAYLNAYGPGTAALVAATGFVIGAVILLAYGGALVAVKDDALVAGRARLPLWAVGGVELIQPADARALRGPNADRRAYLLLRSYMPGTVQVMVEDPADPVPYWLVSTRHPERLAAALRAATASS